MGKSIMQQWEAERAAARRAAEEVKPSEANMTLENTAKILSPAELEKIMEEVWQQPVIRIPYGKQAPTISGELICYGGLSAGSMGNEVLETLLPYIQEGNFTIEKTPYESIKSGYLIRYGGMESAMVLKKADCGCYFCETIRRALAERLL